MKKMIVSLLCLVLALLCIGCRAKTEPDEELKTPDVWSETQENTEPEAPEDTEPETQKDTEPETLENTEPETQKDTEPETQPETQEDDQPETPENVQSVPKEPEGAYYQIVKQLLDSSTLPATAMPVSLCNVSEYEGGKLSPLIHETPGGALVQCCAQRAVNPVAAYRLLAGKGYFDRITQDKEPLTLKLFGDSYTSQACGRNVSVSVPPYSYSEYGCKMLMRDVLLLAGLLNPESVYEGWLTESAEEGLLPEIHYANADNCYYGYYIYYDELGANVLCVYIRSADGWEITDLEFQMLDMEYFYAEPSAGFSIAIQMREMAGDDRIASVIMAAEMLLTGQTLLDIPNDEDLYDWEITLPMSYTLDKWSAKVYRERYHSAVYVGEWLPEGWSLVDQIVNYRISK